MDKLLEQLDARTLRLLMLGVMLVLLSMLFSYGFMPQFKQWQSQQQSIHVLEGVRSGQSDVLSQLDALRDEITKIRRQMRGDLPEMPTQELESFIIGRFQAVSWDSNVDLLSVRPGAGQNIKRFEEISFDVEISGYYRDIFSWLWALGEELGFVVVKKFEITPNTYAAQEPKLLTKLNIVFFQPGETK